MSYGLSFQPVAVGAELPPPGPFKDWGTPSPAAQACYEDIRRRWFALLGWVSAPGKTTGRRYNIFDFPQLATRAQFWAPWEKAWAEQGIRDVTALSAQVSNLRGAELAAAELNAGMIPPQIPILTGTPTPAPDVAQSSESLQAASSVDAFARSAGRFIDELARDGVTGALWAVGLAAAFLLWREGRR